jgi:hypothetical protein
MFSSGKNSGGEVKVTGFAFDKALYASFRDNRFEAMEV